MMSRREELDHERVLVPRGHEDERGVYLVVVAALLLVMIALMGYVVDSANLYNTRIAAQSAADAASLSGAAHLALYERDFSEEDDELDTRTRQIGTAVVEENLLLRGYSLAQIQTNTVEVVRELDPGEPARSKLSVSTRVRVSAPLLLLRFVPGFGSSRDIAVTAESDVRPAIISLAVDFSGSMGCPVNDNCDCFPACTDKKIEFLKTVVMGGLVNYLDGVRDIVSVTTFNTTAETILPPRPLGGFDKGQVNTVLNATAEEGTTNFADALETAYEAIAPATAAQPELDRVLIFFSDGSPTAARLAFANPKGGLPASMTTRGDYDYYSWAVSWQNPPDPTKIDGLSKLAPATIEPDSILCDEAECPTSPGCSTLSVTAAATDDAVTELGNCLDDLKFYDRSGNIWPTIAAPVESYRERFMDSAIAIADTIRAERFLILAVGVGQSPVGVLPYEEPRNEFTRKDNYMRRLVLEPGGGTDFPGYPTFASLLAQTDTHTPGEYYPAPDMPELWKIFRSIAARIRLQMIR